MKKPLSARPDRQDRSSTLEVDTIAASILGFLAADPDRLERFLTITGLTPATLRVAAGDSGFGESLLDYLAGDERLLTAFAAQHGYDPARLEAFRQSLSRRADDD